MSNVAEGMQAAEEADAIIQKLGLGDPDANVSVDEIVAKIEGDGPTEVKADPESSDDKGDKPQGASSGATAEGKDDAKQQEGEPAGILLKDGKHLLPYDKYKQARAEAAEAKARADAAEAKLAELQATGKQPEGEAKGKEDGEGAPQDVLDSIAELEKLAAEYDAEGLTALANAQRVQAKALRAMADKYTSSLEYVEQTRRAAAQAEQEAAKASRTAVEEAIDHNPKLRFLRDTDDPLWDEIADQDAILRANPKFKGLPLEQRFEKAIAAVEAMHGPIKLPAEYLSVADVKAAATKKVDEAGGFTPRTLSDLPGGGLPATTEAEAMSKMSPVQLHRIFEEASDDKIADLLSMVP